MTPERAPLADLVRALGPPLDFLAATDFRHVERTRLPVAALRRAVGDAVADDGSSSVRELLAELRAILDDLSEAPGASEVPRLRRAATLLDALRDAPTSATSSYVASSERVLQESVASLAAPVTTLPGVGPKRASELERFGLETVEDVLYHLPFRYEDRRRLTSLADVRVGDEVSTEGVILAIREPFAGRRGRRLLEVVIGDGAHALALVWFHQTRAVARRFREGLRVLVHGKVEPPMGNGPARIVHPSVTELGEGEAADERAGILPVYEKPTAMPVTVMRRVVQAAARSVAARVPATLPPSVAERHGLEAPAAALRHLHDPPLDASLESLAPGCSPSHRSLAFDELFYLQLGLLLRRRQVGRQVGRAVPRSTRLVPALRAALPFTLTGAQETVLAEIEADLAAPHPMRRLLQGDVGSGKTAVALAAALSVIEQGLQAALMAPTELLAEQHHATIGALTSDVDVEVALLTGSVTGRARSSVLAKLGAGEIDLIVGTHALIQEGVPLERLGFAIVDEQHRFGVAQRASLQRGAGDLALDVLLMSATPIPRTLALTLYGDLDVSTIADLPPGRTPIKTELVREGYRDRAYERVRAAVGAGHQAYVVFPLVEDSDRSDLRAATTMARDLGAGPLAGLRLAVIHGRLRAEQKDEVMRRFKAGEVDVLISTTVIEVGIDVPNATTIVIEHADRFGLAQLHQLRGRVGRGTAPGSCILVAPDWMGEDALQRLRILEDTTSGFDLAEADLALRGPGDFLGTRQAGLPPFRVASLVRDAGLMRAAYDEAVAWLEHDPGLSAPDSRGIVQMLAHRWAGRLELAGVG